MSYAVKEIFYTLQGEGALTGRPAVFCRFAGCNLWSGREEDRAEAVCQFCDTDFVGIDGKNGGRYADGETLADAVAGAFGVVNAVSLYVERGSETFHAVHVEAARRVAAQAQRAGVERLVHISGIGSDPASSSLYIRKRGEGELAARAAVGTHERGVPLGGIEPERLV